MNKIDNLVFDLDDEQINFDQEELDEQPEVLEEEIETSDPIEEEPQESPETNDADKVLARLTYDKYVSLGILEPDEKFDETFDYIETQLEDVPAKLLNQALSELSDEGRSVLEFISAGGNNITKDEIIAFVEAWKEESRTSFDVEDEARSYLEERYRKEGRKAIGAQLDELEDNGELLAEANKLLQEENTKTKKIIETKREQTREEKEAEKQWYSAIGEELKALNYSKKKVEQIQKTMPRGTEVIHAAAKSPKAYIQLIDFLSKWNGKEFDLSDFEKQAQSKTVNKIQEAISKTNISSGGAKTNATSVSQVLTNPDRFVFGVD